MTGFELALTCLALNVFKEARGEPLSGQMAVALVTLNRTKRSAHHDICTTVFEPSQFSWTITDVRNGVLISGKIPNKKSDAWLTAEAVARASFTTPDFTGGATHFHAYYVSPKWAHGMKFVGRLGSHYFYKEKLK